MMSCNNFGQITVLGF